MRKTLSWNVLLIAQDIAHAVKKNLFIGNLNLTVVTTLTAEAFAGRDFRRVAIVFWNLLAGIWMTQSAALEFTSLFSWEQLYRYTRLPFGITDASAIFQQIMNELNGLMQARGILDDLVEIEEDKAQHVSNLHKTLEKLESCVKLKKSKCSIMQPKISPRGVRPYGTPPWNPSIASQG